MGLRASRPVLEDCLQDIPGVKIDGEQVEETSETLGSGAYGEVIVVRYNGVKCACKKLHEALVDNDEQIPHDDPNSPVRKFKEECQRMSKLRHPNIVEFIGVYFKQNSPPCLLMELLPQSLTDFLDKRNETSISADRKCLILLDVAKGLLCLHNHNPPIIHRDLTANNILLTPNLRAKIADFGVARHIQLPSAPGEGEGMTMCPGNLNYMPPEAMKENAFYDTKLDIFSFGHLVIYVTTRKWPILKDKRFRDPITDDCEYRSEIDRRKDSLDSMMENDQLYRLAISCLQEDPNERPVAEDVIRLIPNPEVNSQSLLDENNQLKQKLAAKNLEINELRKQLVALKVRYVNHNCKLYTVPLVAKYSHIMVDLIW